MVKWPVIVINMVGANLRRQHMKDTFPDDSLIFVPGVSTEGQTRESYVESGILKPENLDKYKPTIGEIGCSLGHRNAWQWVINHNLTCVIMEDDVEPTDNYVKNIQNSVMLQGGLNQSANVTFLCHDGGWNCNRKQRYEDGRLISGGGKPSSGNYCYVMTPVGAKKAIEKQFPCYDACDVQWRGLDDMYLIEKPIIKQGSIGRFSQVR